QRRPEGVAADGGAQHFAGAEREPRPPAAQQQRIGVAGMAIMIDGRDIDARQLPAARTQPYAELHLLAAVQIAVAKVAGRRNGLAAIQAAAVEMVYDPGQPVGIVRARPFDVFEILGFALDDDAADAG